MAMVENTKSYRFKRNTSYNELGKLLKDTRTSEDSRKLIRLNSTLVLCNKKQLILHNPFLKNNPLKSGLLQEENVLRRNFESFIIPRDGKLEIGDSKTASFRKDHSDKCHDTYFAIVEEEQTVRLDLEEDKIEEFRKEDTETKTLKKDSTRQTLDASPTHMDTKAHESSDSAVSSFKESDYDFFVNDEEDDSDYCILLNRPLGVSSIQVDEVKRNLQLNCAHSVKLPKNILLGYSDKLSRDQVKQIRKKVLDIHIQKRKKLKGHQFFSVYERKMNKMVNKVTTILYHHILHSHTYIPKPSEGALLFSEDNYLDHPKKLCTSTDLAFRTTFPVFCFSVEKQKSPEEETAQDFDRSEISKMINEIFEKLHLSHECVLITFIYLERLMTKAQVEIRTSNWRPLLLTSIILASKYWEDCGFWNYDFVETYGLYTIESVNKMESLLLGLLEYDLYVSSNLYQQYFKQVTNLANKITKQELKQSKKDDYRKYGFVRSRKHRKSSLLK